MKRCKALITAATVLCSLLCAMLPEMLVPKASAESLKWGEFWCMVNEDGMSVTIVEYEPDVYDLEIPSVIDGMDDISIHAPSEGGDKRGYQLRFYPFAFQSTPPAKGATQIRLWRH